MGLRRRGPVTTPVITTGRRAAGTFACASLVTNYGLLNKTTLWLNTDNTILARSDLVFMTVGRLSVIYRLKKFYFGIVGNSDVTFAAGNKAENEDEVFFYSFLKNDAHLTVGVRF